MLFADTGLTTPQISSLFIIWSVTGIVLEVPSGALADVVSRKALLVAAAFLYGGCFAIWTVVPSYTAFAAGFVLWGTSSAITSGTYEAYVFDQLVDAGAPRAYVGVIARGQSAALLLNLTATVLAAPLIAWGGFPAVGYASVAICLALAGVALTLPSDHARRRADDDLGYIAMLRSGLVEVARRRPVRHAVMVAALLPGYLAFDEYFPLLAIELRAATNAVPVIIAVTVAAQAAGAAIAPRLPRRAAWPCVSLAGLLIGVGVVSGDPRGFGLIAVGYGLLQMVIVVAQTRLQYVITTAARATVTSVSGLLSEVAALAVYAGFAVSSHTAGPARARIGARGGPGGVGVAGPPLAAIDDGVMIGTLRCPARRSSRASAGRSPAEPAATCQCRIGHCPCGVMSFH